MKKLIMVITILILFVSFSGCEEKVDPIVQDLVIKGTVTDIISNDSGEEYVLYFDTGQVIYVIGSMHYDISCCNETTGKFSFTPAGRDGYWELQSVCYDCSD